MATTRPTGIRCTMGMQRHAGGGNALRLLYALPGVTGDWQYPGGGASYSTSGRFIADVDGRLPRRPAPSAGADAEHDAARRGGCSTWTTRRSRRSSSTARTRWARTRTRRACARGLEREDLFTVVMEQFPTDTVDYADIVLPATMQTEHLDVNDGYGHLYVSLNRPAVAPPGECLPTTETFRRLARAMGLDEPALYDDDETLARTLLGDADFERLWDEGWMRLDAASRTCPSPTASRRRRASSSSGRRRRVRTATTRCPANAAAGDDDGEHPLALIAPASHWFLNTIFANKPDLMKRAGEPRITLHPDDAAARGLTDGDARARVQRRAARSWPRSRSSDRVRPGVVASTKGHWLKHVRGGANVNATVEERDADMGGGADLPRQPRRGRAAPSPARDQARGAAVGRAAAVRTSSSLRVEVARARATASSSSATRSCRSTRTCAGA